MNSIAPPSAAPTGSAPYRDPTLPVTDRVADLLGQMTLPEKVGRCCTWTGTRSGPGPRSAHPARHGERAARAATAEIATGLHWTFSPVLCIARDLRWGRVNETFGEDPQLNR